MKIAPSDVVVDGFSFAQVTASGVHVMIEQLDGWKGSPAASFDSVRRAAMPGSLANPGQLNSRILVGTGSIIAPNAAAIEDIEDQINAAISENPVRVEVTEASGRTRWCMAQRQDEVLVRPSGRPDRDAIFSWQMFAEDPLKYGDEIVMETSLPVASGGLTWPTTWPIVWTGTSNTGLIHIYNPGTAPTGVLLTVASVIGPRIRHVGSGGRERVLSSTHAVSGDSTLIFDTGLRSVRENGQASRSQTITERGWPLLEHGPNDFYFSNTGPYNPAARMTLTAIPAWK